MVRFILRLCSAVVLVLFFVSCDNLISYSPFDADVQTKHLNTSNIASLQAVPFTPGDTLRFAVISDPHHNYDDLKDAIASINNLKGLSFVVCCGDITNWGTKDEFDWYWDKAKKSAYPLITLIGNHDYLSNGKLIYNRMFGSANFTFDYGGYQFVVFDDVVWENNNTPPDIDWLAAQITADRKRVLLTHIPLWGDQLEGELSHAMDSVIAKGRFITVISGHNHDREKVIRGGIPHYVVNDIDDRLFALVTLCGSEMTLQMIDF